MISEQKICALLNFKYRTNSFDQLFTPNGFLNVNYATFEYLTGVKIDNSERLEIRLIRTDDGFDPEIEGDATPERIKALYQALFNAGLTNNLCSRVGKPRNRLVDSHLRCGMTIANEHNAFFNSYECAWAYQAGRRSGDYSYHAPLDVAAE